MEVEASHLSPWYGKIFALLRNKKKQRAVSEEESGKGCHWRGKKARLLQGTVLEFDFAFLFNVKPLEGFAYCFRIKVEKFHASLV